MRKIDEFKGYRSIIVYDEESATFVSEAIPEERMAMTLNEALQAWAEILPFPETIKEEVHQLPRKTG